jgi:hypothetical protein
MFCLVWSTHTYSEDDVEEGGMKIQKNKTNFHEHFIGQKNLTILFLFQITTVGCQRIC